MPESQPLSRSERRALERILETARLHESRDRPERRVITTNWLIEVCEEELGLTAGEWCPVCHTYHVDPGEKTDAGRLTRPCPLLPASVGANHPINAEPLR